jgi:hypothetical protein
MARVASRIRQPESEAELANIVALQAFAQRALQFREQLTSSQIQFLEDLLTPVVSFLVRRGWPVSMFIWHIRDDCARPRGQWRHPDPHYDYGPSDPQLAQRFAKIWIRIEKLIGLPATEFEKDLAAYAEAWRDESQARVQEILEGKG